MAKKNIIRVFEGFAGYGGASFGLKRLKENMPNIEYKVVGYSEFDKFASSLFDANIKDKNGNSIMNWGDITQIDPEKLPDFDLFTGGFPCQPFSSAGMQLGTDDPYGRGAMLGHIIRICKVKKPKYILLENVKNLAANHHNPSSYYDWIIAEADRLSSGSDRCNILGLADSKKENDFDEEKEKLKFYEKPMLHILSTLQLDDKPEPKKAYCKMAVLDNDNVLSDKDYKTSKDEYKKLWDDFVKNFQKLQNLSYDNFLLSLNSLLERYKFLSDGNKFTNFFGDSMIKSTPDKILNSAAFSGE